MISVLNTLFEQQQYDKSNIAFLEYILLAILEHGKKEHMDRLFEAINDCRIPPSIKMKQYYFKSVDKDQLHSQRKRKIHRNSFAKEEKKTMDAYDLSKEKERKVIESIKKSGKLRKRTFKSYQQRKNLLIEETVSFHIPGRCSSCGKISDCNQIFKTIETSDSFKCFFCGYEQFLILHVCVGHKSDNDDLQTSLTFECNLNNEIEIIELVKHLYDTSVHENEQNSQKFDLMILREHREAVLWNCILFFKHYGLPFDFILPFEDLEQKYTYETVNADNRIKEVYSADEI